MLERRNHLPLLLYKVLMKGFEAVATGAKVCHNKRLSKEGGEDYCGAEGLEEPLR